MRLAIAISLGVASLVVSLARADAPFAKVTMDAGIGYIVPADYAEAHKDAIVASIPGHVVVDGFWTVSEQDITVAERIFRELLHRAEKDPTILFPNLSPDTDASSRDSLAYQQQELEQVNKHYHAYIRQYLGIIIDGRKLVLCNYSDSPAADPLTEYLYLEKYFEPGGKVHFLQCRVNVQDETWCNVSIIGTWQKDE